MQPKAIAILTTTDKYFTIRNSFCHTTPCISVHISFETTRTGCGQRLSLPLFKNEARKK